MKPVGGKWREKKNCAEKWMSGKEEEEVGRNTEENEIEEMRNVKKGGEASVGEKKGDEGDREVVEREQEETERGNEE